MDINSNSKELCHGCSKNILKHNSFIICSNCQRICHSKCAKKLYSFNFIEDTWCCWECSSLEETRYNPFKSYRYDKYSQPDNENFSEIHQIENLLNECKRYNFQELSKIVTNSNEQMSIMFNNIDGVTANFDSFTAELMLKNNNLSILTLAETNLDECNKNLFNITGFQSIYQSKIVGKNKGSGLAIYVKETLLFTEIDAFNQCSTNLEALFITISNTNDQNPITVGVLYRPPSGDEKSFISEFNLLLQKLPLNNVYLCGDFNVNLLKNSASEFENILFSNGFAPTISIATHFKPGCLPSCIDNILTNSTDSIIRSGVCNIVSSHHCPIFCITSTKWDPCEAELNLPSHDFNETNMIKFQSEFMNYLYSKEHFNEAIIDETNFDELMNSINKLVDDCFTMDKNVLVSKRNRIINPWITSGIIASIAKKDYLYQIWRQSIKKLKCKEGDPLLYSNYKEYRKLLKGIINSAKKMHKLKKFDKAQGNSRETWKIINEIRGKQKSKIKPSFIIDDLIVEERRAIANGFNKYFTSIASKLNECDDGIPILPIPNYADYIKNSVESSIFLDECSPDEINEIIKDLSSNKASDIPIKILKCISTITSPILAKFFNAFISSGIFPKILKTGIVSPVYKKGDPQKFDNYRPISTLPVFSKIFEKILYKRIYSFLVAKNILYEKQFGFRKDHSTSHAINYSVKYITDNIEQKKHVIGLFLDLSKAFDTICHSKLLHKLSNYGIRGNCLELIKSYLSSRQQITKFNGTQSETESILYGVPQGSVLGPLLFLLYINDIVHSSTKGEYVIFADDTNVFIADNDQRNAYKLANEVLRSIFIYMRANQLHINLSKCAYMHFRPNLNHNERLSCARTSGYDHELTLSLNGHKVKKVDKIKFLGVIIDDKLNWDNQIEHLENKLLSTIVLIKRVKKFIPSSHYPKIYQSLFVSHLTYGISCWGGVYPSKLQKLFNLQKRCIRILFGESYSFDHPEYYTSCARARTYLDHISLKDYTLEHTKPIFNKHSLLTIQNLYTSRALTELLKTMKYQSPSPIYEKLKLCPKTNHFKLLCPMHKLDISKNNFFIKPVNLWNACIKHLLDSSELSNITYLNKIQLIIPGSNANSDLTIPIGIFKNRLKHHLLTMQKLGSSTDWSKENFLSSY